MTTSDLPMGAGIAAPKSDNAPGQGCVIGAKEAADNPNCTDIGADCKAHSTLIARAGFELIHQADESWLIQRWGMCRPLASDPEVERFLAQVGAA